MPLRKLRRLSTGSQIVWTFADTQVLLLQKSLEVFAEPLFKMITPCLLPPLAGFVALVELRQPLDQLREARVRVVLEVVFLESLELAGQTALPRGAVQYAPLVRVLRADCYFLFRHAWKFARTIAVA